MKSLFQTALLMSAAMTVPALSSDTNLSWERDTQGECQEVFGGQVCTWSREHGDELVAFGATIPLATIENAPLEGEMVFPPIALARIALPESVQKSTGVNHLGVNWEVHGHPPAPFMTPHFDFHFYTVDTGAVDAIDCSDLTKPEVLPETYVLPDETLPDGTVLVGVCVPAMGMHSLAEPELTATSLFEASMVVGYYSGNLVFIEPMIARDRLMRHEDFTVALPQVDAHGMGESWPDGFSAHFDEPAGAWQLTFTMPVSE